MTKNVSMQDVRAAGFCSKGARETCARLGINWNELITNGLPPEAFHEHLDNHHIQKLLEVYHGRQ